jgi:hypothetical protein
MAELWANKFGGEGVDNAVPGEGPDNALIGEGPEPGLGLQQARVWGRSRTHVTHAGKKDLVRAGSGRRAFPTRKDRPGPSQSKAYWLGFSQRNGESK